MASGLLSFLLLPSREFLSIFSFSFFSSHWIILIIYFLLNLCFSFRFICHSFVSIFCSMLAPPVCDYFAIIGYAPSSGLKQERISEFGDSSSANGPPSRKSPLDATYEPKVIAHFPSERPNKPFAPEIASLALPQGIRLCTERNVPREPSFHSFVVIREDGTRIYGCSLIYFEEMRSSELRQQIFNAQLDYLREFASSSSGPSPISVDPDQPPSAALSPSPSPSHLPSPHPTKTTNNHPNYHHISRKFTTNSLPRKLSSTKRMGSAHSAVNFGEESREEEFLNYYKNPKSPLFISKCMAIITPVPIIYSSENLLHNLWVLINDKSPLKEYSLEDLLHWMLHELSMPSPSASMQLSFSDFHLLIRVPGPGQLPFFDYPIETLFAHISADQFLKLLTCLLLEQQILIISKNARNLMLVAECLSVLAFPFSWQMPYCPILPHTQLKFLEAPIPWLMGLCLEESQLPKQLYQSNICLLNVDSRKLDLPEDLPSFPRQQQIIGEINQLLRSSCNQREQNESESVDGKSEVHRFYLRGLRFNNAIRELFLAQFATLFSAYEGYVLGASSGADNGLVQAQMPKFNRRRGRNGRVLRESSANFDKISFLVDQPESVLAFLSAFLETQMFTSFIDAKILAQQNPSKTENVLLFDQKIATLFDRQNLTNNGEELKRNTPKELEPKLELDPSEKEPTEFARPIPRGPVSARPTKYGGILPVPEQAKLEKTEPTNRAKMEGLEEEERGRTPEATERMGNDENEQERGVQKEIGIVKMDERPERKDPRTGNTMAPHQNWRFVEQLLKETKAKTKRILVAKMGNEAVHLGYGQLHLGISGVEENTLVASFCDLLERIWSHGLKKKQGKSALWNYIIAYHEWEKKYGASRTASRRTSSASNVEKDSHAVPTETRGVDSRPLSEAEDEGAEVAEGVSKAMQLISSIRRLADGGEERRPEGKTVGRGAVAAGDGSDSENSTASWSHSLLRAANVICERISAAGGGSDSGGDGGRRHAQKQQQPGARMDRQRAKPTSNTLPPRPPPPWQRQNGEGREKDPEPEETEKEHDAPQEPNSYRKYIYQGPPLKPRNSQVDKMDKEQQGREGARHRRGPRSASSHGQGGWASLINDLASHLSEDSLSRLALSSIGPDKTATTTRRRARDLSHGPGGGGQPQMAPPSVPRQRNRSLSRSNSPSRLYERLTRGAGAELRQMSPIPNTMAYDLKNIVRMIEIKTDIGFARAFVRLALERKCLYHYLKKLLSNTQLLQKMYKRYSFLRCDDEREQFLFHLLSLNAVDFSCFTNTFLTIKMRYEVLLVGSLDRFPSGLVYIMLTGSHGCTSAIFLPANSVQFTFDLKNLGTLSTLRIGHSISEKGDGNLRLSKWFLDYVLVRNCVTAQTFYFRCGRWFGRGIDDGALERLLVAEAILTRRNVGEEGEDEEGERGPELTQRPESPGAGSFLSPRKGKYSNGGGGGGAERMDRERRLRSPSNERGRAGGTAEGEKSAAATALDEQHQVLEHRVGMAVNALTKHFLTEKDQQSSSAKLSTLLCSEDGGLLPSLDDIFSFGLIQRIFRQTYPWDYIEKAFVWFRQFFCTGESKKFTQEQRSLIIYTYNLVTKITTYNAVGKEGKFHLFVLFCLRDHILSGLLPLLAWTPVTGQLYEPRAFLRQPTKLAYMARLISTLNEFQFHYEKSLLQGIDAPWKS